MQAHDDALPARHASTAVEVVSQSHGAVMQLHTLGGDVVAATQQNSEQLAPFGHTAPAFDVSNAVPALQNVPVAVTSAALVVVVVVVVDDVDFLVLVTDPAGRREQEPEDVGVSPRRRLHRDGPAVARLQPEVRAAS